MTLVEHVTKTEKKTTTQRALYNFNIHIICDFSGTCNKKQKQKKTTQLALVKFNIHIICDFSGTCNKKKKKQQNRKKKY